MSFTIAIIGRPNVGKSTLFNRLAGKRIAVVDDMPGVTRDRQIAPASIGPLNFNIIDTAGLEKDFTSEIEEKAFSQTGKALDDADIGLFVIDGRAGITPLDQHFAGWLRKKNKAVILVVNKCEGKAVSGITADAYRLGFGEPVGISAEHGEGLADLYEAIENKRKSLDVSGEEEAAQEKTLRITIAGRPNSGKSTLFNAILGEERMVVSKEAGTTRDSVAIITEHKGKKFEIIDTAGMRRKANIDNKIEKTSVGQSLRAIKFANVVILLLDATLKMEKQDLTIADLALKEGRALVIAVNKWDLIKDHAGVLEDIKDRLEKSLSQVHELPLVFISAKIGKNIDKLLDACFDVFDLWNSEISTSKLNRWLEQAIEVHTPPMVKGKRLKLRYMTQTATRPPTFSIFVSNKAEFPDSYLRYLQNSLKETFGLTAIVVRMILKKNKNPFDQPKEN